MSWMSRCHKDGGNRLERVPQRWFGVEQLEDRLLLSLPAGWLAGDVGAVAAAGSSDYNAGTFTVTGSGANIWGTNDEFQYCYQQQAGDFEMVVRLASSPAGSTGFYGLMVRESLDDSARFRMVSIRPTDNMLKIHYRTYFDGTCVHQDLGAKATPYWLKLTRYDGIVTPYWSVDGQTWNRVNYQADLFEGTVYVGMAVCSTSDGTLKTATFDNVSVGPLSLAYDTSWIGNTYGGGDRHVQNFVSSMYVHPTTGQVFINGEDENKSVSSYDANGKFLYFGANSHFQHGYAITADDTYFYQGRTSGFVRYKVSNGDGAGTTYLSGKDIRGLACHNGNLYISDATDNLIRVFNASTMTEVSNFAFARPRGIAVDRGTGELWIIQDTDGVTAAKVLKYTAAGVKLTPEISDAGTPRGLAVDNTGKLYVTDTGVRQYVRIYNSTGALVSTFGAENGLLSTYGGTVPGEVHAKKFNNPVAVGVDNNGNIYVASNGPKAWWGAVASGTGTELRKFDSAGNLVWERYGLEYVDCADVLPSSDGTVVYTKEAKYVLDLSQPTGQQWTYKAMTVDPFAYPNDPRLKTPKSGGVFMREFNGQKFLYVTDMVSEYLHVYRFEAGSEIAIPSAQFYRGTDNNKVFWIWRDIDGDGQIEDTEKSTATYDRELWGWYVDDTGDVWAASRLSGVTRYNMGGLDSQGNPIYTFSDKTFWARPAEVGTTNGQLMRAAYDSVTDTMFIGAYTDADPKPSTAKEWGCVGTRILRYNNWTTAPTLAYQIDLPYAPNTTGGHETWAIKSFDVAGEYVFAVRSADAKVFVYNISDGSLVTTLEPGPEVGGHSGLVDIPVGLNAYQRANGQYMVLVEDDDNGKVIFYRYGEAAEPPGGGMYDDFSDPSASVGKWTVYDIGAGAVTFDGSQVILDMTNASTGKQAAVRASQSALRLNDTGDLFRVAWDQQTLVFGTYGSSDGLSIGSVVSIGQYGNHSSLSDKKKDFFLGAQYGTVQPAAGRYHYDLSAEMLDADTGLTQLTLNVYQYNSAYDASPATYRTSGVLLCTLATTATFTAATDYSLTWFAQSPNSTDTYAQQRDKIAVDNCFLEYVPFQATVLEVYDDFADPATSPTRWSVNDQGNGSVTFDGTQAVLDMTSATTGKAAAITASGAFVRMNNTGDAYKVAWDAEILVFGTSGWSDGLQIGSGLAVGQYGNHTGLGDKRKDFYLGAVYGATQPAAGRYHFDLRLEMMDATTGQVSATLSVYAYDAALNATPDAYVASRTPLQTLATTCTLAAGMDHSVTCFAQNPSGVDTYAQQRDKLAVDNLACGTDNGGMQAPDPALVKLDDFSNPSASASIWTTTEAGAGDVTFDGSKAVLNMSSASAGKVATIQATNAFARLDADGEVFRMSWDMQIQTLGAYGMGNGLVIGSGLNLGQYGDHSSLGTSRQHFFLGATAGSYGAGVAKYHYDLRIEMLNAATGLVSVAMKVYAYDASLDNTPDAYAASGTLVEALTTTATLAAGVDHSLKFYATTSSGTDAYAQARDAITIDNVFVS